MNTLSFPQEQYLILTDAYLGSFLMHLKEISGYDFSLYSKASIRRRLVRVMELYAFNSPSDILKRLKTAPLFMRELINEITVNHTEMFRDPSFFSVLRSEVLPEFKQASHFKVWHAGCSSGEEVYSMAIALFEEGLLNQSYLYATDLNEGVLTQAEKGEYSLDHFKSYSDAYFKAGGLASLSTYYQIDGDKVVFKPWLRKHFILSQHNLAVDSSFNEFDLILCRNVMIYFEKDLQERVYDLFIQSMRPGSYLAIGPKESIPLSRKHFFEPLSEEERIYRYVPRC